MRIEIRKHYSKLSKISGLTIDEVQEAEYRVYRDVKFISEEQIKNSTWEVAAKLVADVDPNDILYVAFSKHFKCKSWSGDKALAKGLATKGFSNFITTDELFKIREKLSKKL